MVERLDVEKIVCEKCGNNSPYIQWCEKNVPIDLTLDRMETPTEDVFTCVCGTCRFKWFIKAKQ